LRLGAAHLAATALLDGDVTDRVGHRLGQGGAETPGLGRPGETVSTGHHAVPRSENPTQPLTAPIAPTRAWPGRAQHGAAGWAAAVGGPHHLAFRVRLDFCQSAEHSWIRRSCQWRRPRRRRPRGAPRRGPLPGRNAGPGRAVPGDPWWTGWTCSIAPAAAADGTAHPARPPAKCSRERRRPHRAGRRYRGSGMPRSPRSTAGHRPRAAPRRAVSGHHPSGPCPICSAWGSGCSPRSGAPRALRSRMSVPGQIDHEAAPRSRRRPCPAGGRYRCPLVRRGAVRTCPAGERRERRWPSAPTARWPPGCRTGRGQGGYRIAPEW